MMMVYHLLATPLYKWIEPCLIDVHDEVVMRDHYSLRLPSGPAAEGKNDYVFQGVPV